MLKKSQITQDFTTQQDYQPTESSTPPIQEHCTNNSGYSSNAQLIQKIIASNEDLIHQQMMTIRELKRQNVDLQKKNKEMTQKYNELLLFASTSAQSFASKAFHSPAQSEQKVSLSGESVGQISIFNIEEMLTKIMQLEQQLSTAKVELAMKSAEVLSYSLKRSHPSQNTPARRKTEQLQKSKTNLQCYFQPKPLERSPEFERKGSSEIREKQLIESWNKQIDLYCNSEAKLSKFKDKTQSLIKKFIPKELRGTVWSNLIQNRLGMTNALYIELLQRRSQKWVSEKVRSQIDKDIKRSFYGKTQYQTKTSIIMDVCEFLEIFHLFRPDVSYVQGMTYPAIILIPILGKVRAFNLFCNLILGNSFFRKTFSLQDNFVEMVCRAFELLLLQYQPDLYWKMQNDGLQSQIFLIEWLFTFFSRGFKYETTLKFWDHLLYFEEVAMFRMALSVFEQLGPLILELNYEESINLVREFGKNVDEEKLLESLSNSKLNGEKLHRILEKASSLIT